MLGVAVLPEKFPHLAEQHRQRCNLAFRGHSLDWHANECDPFTSAPHPDFAIFLGASLSPGDDPVGENRLAAQMRYCLDQRIPTIAICYSHQIAATHLFGATLRKRAPYVGLRTLRLTDAAVFDPWLGQFTASGRLVLTATHEWHVDVRPSKQFELLARSDECAVDIMKWGDRFYSVQGHPEVDGGGFYKIFSHGILSQDDFFLRAIKNNRHHSHRGVSDLLEDTARDTFELPNDGQALIGSFLRWVASARGYPSTFQQASLQYVASKARSHPSGKGYSYFSKLPIGFSIDAFGKAGQLGEIRGGHYFMKLVSQPDKPIPAVALHRHIESKDSGTSTRSDEFDGAGRANGSSSQPLHDARARREYETQSRELAKAIEKIRQELSVAYANGHDSLAAELQDHLTLMEKNKKFIDRELKRGKNRFGRHKRFSDSKTSDSARRSTDRRIKDVFDKLSDQGMDALVEHLRDHMKLENGDWIYHSNGLTWVIES